VVQLKRQENSLAGFRTDLPKRSDASERKTSSRSRSRVRLQSPLEQGTGVHIAGLQFTENTQGAPVRD
jgi:hypothetical protein